METNWAAEHLQTIRTLMERSAVYRRALAPVMTIVGVIGLAAAVGCFFFSPSSSRTYVLYWMAVGILAMASAFLLIRKQALQAGETFWSPPTRRIAQAMFPAMFVGLFTGLLLCADTSRSEGIGLTTIPWCICYGCALHAAGFFIPRGIKILGWLFICVGCAAALVLIMTGKDGRLANTWDLLYDPRGFFMGITFGGLHLAYGIYLYLTENRKNAA